VRRLNVYTFHAFAIKNLKRVENSNDWDADRSNLLSDFANQLESDSLFRLNIAGALRTVLVDEFQDMNDDLFRIVQAISLKAGVNAGVMVIGDDDQDILGWNRVGRESSDVYFEKFTNDFKVEEAGHLDLKVNFRSGKEVVVETQKFLEDFFSASDVESARLKKNILSPGKDTDVSVVLRINNNNLTIESQIEKVAEKCVDSGGLGLDGSLAILCRTNNDVSNVYFALREKCQHLKVQNNSSYPVSQLRHVGIWCDLFFYL